MKYDGFLIQAYLRVQLEFNSLGNPQLEFGISSPSPSINAMHGEIFAHCKQAASHIVLSRFELYMQVNLQCASRVR